MNTHELKWIPVLWFIACYSSLFQCIAELHPPRGSRARAQPPMNWMTLYDFVCRFHQVGEKTTQRIIWKITTSNIISYNSRDGAASFPAEPENFDSFMLHLMYIIMCVYCMHTIELIRAHDVLSAFFFTSSQCMYYVSVQRDLGKNLSSYALSVMVT